MGTLLAAVVSVLQFWVGGEDGKPTTARPPSPPALVRGPVGGEDEPYEYTELHSEGNEIRLEVPTAWADVRSRPWLAFKVPPIAEGTPLGAGINATTDFDAWRNDLRTPGVFVGVSSLILSEYSPERLVETTRFAGCRPTERRSGVRLGEGLVGASVTHSCPGTSARWHLLAARPERGRAYLVYIQLKSVAPRDEQARQRILATLELSPG